MRPPRILALSQEVHPIPPTKGAAVEQWIVEVAHRCTRYVPLVVSVPHPQRCDEEIVDGVHYRRIRIGNVYKRLFRKLTRLDPWSYCSRIVAFARPHKPALVHVHNAPQFVDALRRGLPDAKIVLHMHNEKDLSFVSQVDALIGCSRYISDWFAQKHARALIFGVLPNGVDTTRFHPPTPEQRTAARLSLGLPNDRFIVLYAGRISPEKGPDLLVEAFRCLNSSRFHLCIAGEWPKGDPRTSNRVAYARTLERKLVRPSVSILGSRVPSDMADVYHAADLIVIPSRFEEPFSMVAIEAMACGVPVLALAKGGMSEYMRDGVNARVLQPHATAEDIGAEIHAISERMEYLARLKSEARRLVESKFDWNNVAAETENLYDRLLHE